MAYVMITESLHDQNFLNTFTTGFNKFKEYRWYANIGDSQTLILSN